MDTIRVPLALGQHLVQGAQVGAGAGYDDVGTGPVAAEGAEDGPVCLRIDDVGVLTVGLDADCRLGHGI